MNLSLAERPGPVHLDIPNDLLTRQAGPEKQSSSAAEDVASEIVGNLDAVVNAIDSAAKPVLVVGPAVVRSNACDELRTLAERLGAAVVTTSKAPGSHPGRPSTVGRDHYRSVWRRDIRGTHSSVKAT